MFRIGEDPTYRVIEDGEWIKEGPYGVIHRMASSGRKKGMTAECIQWCFDQCGNLRCDTHQDNKVMQHVLEKNGFTLEGTLRSGVFKDGRLQDLCLYGKLKGPDAG